MFQLNTPTVAEKIKHSLFNLHIIFCLLVFYLRHLAEMSATLFYFIFWYSSIFVPLFLK